MCIQLRLFLQMRQREIKLLRKDLEYEQRSCGFRHQNSVLQMQGFHTLSLLLFFNATKEKNQKM